MKELLNKLIEKGWKPFGALGNAKNGVYTNKYLFFEGCADGITLRQLASKESGLWQFVCENGMRPKRPGYEEHIWQRDGKTNGDRCILENEYQYYLIESALCDEDKLEEFLLDNIKV